MSYLYSAENRLVSPANYQYAAFGGQAYLAEYLRAREKALEALGVRPLAASSAALIHLLAEYASNADDVPIDALSVDQTIRTQTLLGSLASWARENKVSATGEVWLRRMIQRFEVSKRLYSAYPPGFRKGEGDSAQIELYVLFAALLWLRHLQTGNLQCLSTLLKATDLLCSLLPAQLPPETAKMLALIIELETESVRKLADEKGLKLGT